MKLGESSGEKKNYQPVMILTLNKSTNGEASKEKIIKQLQKYNPQYQLSDFDNCPVFSVLEKRNVAKFNPDKNKYELLDYDEINTHFGRKAEITK